MGFFKHASREDNCCDQCAPEPCDPCPDCEPTLSCEQATATHAKCGESPFNSGDGLFLHRIVDMHAGTVTYGSSAAENSYWLRYDAITSGQSGATGTITSTRTYDPNTCELTCGRSGSIEGCDCSYGDFFPCDVDCVSNYNGEALYDATLSNEFTTANLIDIVLTDLESAEYSPLEPCGARLLLGANDISVEAVKLRYTITVPTGKTAGWDIVFTPQDGSPPTTTHRSQLNGIVEEIIPEADDPPGSWSIQNVTCG